MAMRGARMSPVSLPVACSSMRCVAVQLPTTSPLTTTLERFVRERRLARAGALPVVRRREDEVRMDDGQDAGGAQAA